MPEPEKVEQGETERSREQVIDQAWEFYSMTFLGVGDGGLRVLRDSVAGVPESIRPDEVSLACGLRTRADRRLDEQLSAFVKSEAASQSVSRQDVVNLIGAYHLREVTGELIEEAKRFSPFPVLAD